MTEKRKQELPVDVYIPFVETLFRDGATLAVGIASQTMVIALVYWKTGDPAYLAIAASLIVIGVLRIMSFGRHNRLPPAVTRDEARSRENTYILYGCLHAVALGTFCFVAIYFADDSFAELAAVCTALATATAIAGRNYGSPRMVIILIIALTWPISLGFMLRGDPYHIVLGLLSAQFLFTIRKFADTVRDVLFTAIFEEKKATRIAQRFNRALNTMSHGLIMLGPDGRVVVANAEAAQLMSLKSPDALLGRSHPRAADARRRRRPAGARRTAATSRRN